MVSQAKAQGILFHRLARNRSYGDNHGYRVYGDKASLIAIDAGLADLISFGFLCVGTAVGGILTIYAFKWYKKQEGVNIPAENKDEPATQTSS